MELKAKVQGEVSKVDLSNSKQMQGGPHQMYMLKCAQPGNQSGGSRDPGAVSDL